MLGAEVKLDKSFMIYMHTNIFAHATFDIRPTLLSACMDQVSTHSSKVLSYDFFLFFHLSRVLHL